jgi:prepilin-type N-terminal cleavage/methylation domain-containing protein
MPEHISVVSRGRQHGGGAAGFGMVELMVSMFVLAIVLTGAYRALDNARRATEIGSMMTDGTQNLRMAVTLMTRDIVQTGRELPNSGIPIPDGTSIVAIGRPGPPGSSLTFPSDWTVIPSICPGNALGPTVNNVPTDIVTVLYADPTLALNQYPLASIATDGSRATVNAATVLNNALTGIQAGDLIWFTNGIGDAIQTVTSVSGQNLYFAQNSTADPYHFNQRTGATAGTILQMMSGGAFPTTSATRVTMVSYYIDTVTAAGQFRLMRREGNRTPRLVAMGIENLQATYDIIDGATNPTNQVEAVAPYSPSEIRKINLFLGRRSDRVLLQTNRLVRSSVATQISLRSMSFRDRYE